MITQDTMKGITDAIEAKDLGRARQLLGKISADDAIAVIERLPDPAMALAFRLLDKKTMLEVFELLPTTSQADLLRSMTADEAVRILDEIDTDEVVQILEEMPAKVVKRLISMLSSGQRTAINSMLGYPEGTAGRRMNPSLLTSRRSHTVADVLRAIKDSQLEAEDLDVVFVIDQQRFFHGYVQVADLLRAQPDVPMIQLAERPGVAVRTDDPETKAAQVVRRTDLPAIAVLDQENRLVGCLAREDLMDVEEEEASRLIYAKAGVADLTSKKDHLFSKRLTQGNILYPIRVRILFLFVTLIGGLIVGGVIERFEDMLEAVIAAAIFIPLVMDMGGNVGTQSTTIFARGFALGHIKLGRFWRYLGREALIGLSIGLILGTLAGVIAYFWQGAPNDIPQIGLAVGISLATVITLAAMLGFFLPYIMTKMGLDHAPGADPFITTIKDFTGLSLYFFLVYTLIGIPEDEDDHEEEARALFRDSNEAVAATVVHARD